MWLLIIAIILPILIGYISSVLPTRENVDAKLRIFVVVILLIMIAIIYSDKKKNRKSNPKTSPKNSVTEPVNCNVEINCSSPCESAGEPLYIKNDCSRLCP